MTKKHLLAAGFEPPTPEVNKFEVVFVSFVPDADCGRGFIRIESNCVNISLETATPTDTPTIDARCQSIGAGQFSILTPMLQYLMKVPFLTNLIVGCLQNY